MAPPTLRASGESERTQLPSPDVEEKPPSAESVSPTHDLERGSTQASSDAGDGNIVQWDGDDDPENPYNWPTRKKFINCGLVSCLTLLAPLASSAFAPGTPQLLQDFDSTSTELSAFVLSVYVLGYAVGPMLAAPLSETYGRSIIYLTTNIGFVAFLIGCALAPSMSSFIAFRFLSGAFGSCVLANGGGTIADMIAPAQRGRVMAAFSAVPMIGPIVGPIAGGFLAASKGWRWVFWALAIVAGVATVCAALFMDESYAPVLLERRARALRRATGNALLRSKFDAGLTPARRLRRSIVRPCRLLVRSPLVLVFAVYMVVIYGYLYLLFASVSVVFQNTYGFSTSASGLVFLSIGLGSITSLVWHSMTSDGEAAKQSASGKCEPEFRLKLLPYGAFCIPVGFFIYGWTAHYETHWMGPLVGLYFFGLGNVLSTMTISTYVVDAFTLYAASALASLSILRSIAGAVLPLGASKVYDTLGLGWGNSLLGFISCTLVPIPFLILKYGAYLRKKYEIKDL